MSYQEVQPNIEAVEAMKSTFRPFNNFKLAEGRNTFRILPPFGTDNKGVWFHEWYLHWGFMDANGNRKPLACSYRGPERFCPICEQAREIRNTMDAMVADYTVEEDGRKKTNWDSIPDNVKAKHKELRDKWGAIRANRRYFYNAVDRAGDVGILQLTAKTGDALNAEIKVAVQQKNFNPLSLRDGCFFDIIKTKTGPLPINVEYSVKFNYKTQEVTTPGGEVVTADVIERGSVSAALLENFEELAYDIHVLYPTRSAAELQAILNGDPVPSTNGGFSGSRNGNGNGNGAESKTTVAETSKTAVTILSDDDRLAELKSALQLG